MKFFITLNSFAIWLIITCANNFVYAKNDTKIVILQGIKQEIDNIQLNTEVSKSIDGIIMELTHKGSVSETGVDDELRPIYVFFQGILEKSLSNYIKENPETKLQIIFHTPTPPTPFCLTSEDNPDTLMHASIKNNKDSQNTVKLRQQTLNSLLINKANIVNIFPESGFNKRTEEQIKNYNHIKQQFNEQFFDIITSLEIDKKHVGATYILTDDNDIYTFSISASQVNSPKDIQDKWQIVFSCLNDNDTENFHWETFKYLIELTEDKVKQYLP